MSDDALALSVRLVAILEEMVTQRRAEVARLRELVAAQEAANRELYATALDAEDATDSGRL